MAAVVSAPLPALTDAFCVVIVPDVIPKPAALIVVDVKLELPALIELF